MRPVLIAECCQNHQGRRGTLQRMIHAATEAGADFVKIQALYSRDLTYRERFEDGLTASDGTVAAIKRPYQAEVDRLATLDLTPDDEAWFVDECRRAGVQSMVTVFTRATATRLGELGFDAVKVASYDCRSFPLLRDLRRWWSTIVVSTGATYDAEIARAAEVLQGVQFAFLHCVTLYPTPLESLHLRRMAFLRRFTPWVGYSDHTKVADTGLLGSKAALAVGAELLERHFTVLDPTETKDGPVSVDPDGLAELRSFADLSRPERMERLVKEYPEWEQALGVARRDLAPAELLNRDYYAGRVASKVGGRDVFNWEDVDLDVLTGASGIDEPTP